MTCSYHSEWDALREASRMRRQGFQCMYTGLSIDGWYKVKVW